MNRFKLIAVCSEFDDSDLSGIRPDYDVVSVGSCREQCGDYTLTLNQSFQQITLQAKGYQRSNNREDMRGTNGDNFPRLIGP
jgi:hypothetical protein